MSPSTETLYDKWTLLYCVCQRNCTISLSRIYDSLKAYSGQRQVQAESL